MLNKLTDVTYEIIYALIYIICNFVLWRLITKYRTDLVLFQHSRPKIVRGHVNVMSFPESPSICPVLSLRDYLVRTAPLRAVDAQHMFIQLRQPHKSVSSQTLARWITSMMADAGVDTSSFHQHSTRSASAAWLGSGTNKKMSVAQICKQGHWSRATTTFRKFYHRVVLHTERR